MASKRVAPKKIKDSTQVVDMITSWFEAENKPVTAQSLTDALGSRASKPLVQKTLDDLFAQGTLLAKDLKKVRFFYLNVVPLGTNATEQGGDANGNTGDNAESQGGGEDPEEAALKEALLSDITSLAAAVKHKEALLEILTKKQTAAERAERLASTRKEVEALKSQIDAVKVAQEAKKRSRENDSCKGKKKSIKQLVAQYQRARCTWRERREYAQRLVDCVFGDGCTETWLAEMFGYVTDKEAGVSLQQSAMPLPPSCRSAGRAVSEGIDLTSRHPLAGR